jgi:hypothetical protein
MSSPEDERVAGATLKERTVGRRWQLFEPIDAAYERGDIDAAEWHRRMGAIIGAHTELAGSDPQLEAEVASWGFLISSHLRSSRGYSRTGLPRRTASVLDRQVHLSRPF